jgi:hypothetical protein
MNKMTPALSYFDKRLLEDSKNTGGMGTKVMTDDSALG